MKITVFIKKMNTVFNLSVKLIDFDLAYNALSDKFRRCDPQKISVEFYENMCYNIVKRLKEDLAWEKKNPPVSETALNIL